MPVRTVTLNSEEGGPLWRRLWFFDPLRTEQVISSSFACDVIVIVAPGSHPSRLLSRGIYRQVIATPFLFSISAISKKSIYAHLISYLYACWVS